MKGRIVHYDPMTATGLIRGEDAQDYPLQRSFWSGVRMPHPGDDVEILTDHTGQITAITCLRLEQKSQPFDWKWFLFSPQGRVPRSWFWKRFWVPLMAIYLCASLFWGIGVIHHSADFENIQSPADFLHRVYAANPVGLWLMIGIPLLTYPTRILLIIRRLHDCDKSWKHVLLLLASDLAVSFMFLTMFHVTIGDSIPDTYIPSGKIFLFDGLALSIQLYAVKVSLTALFQPGSRGDNRFGGDPLLVSDALLHGKA